MSVTRLGPNDDFLMFDMEMDGCPLLSNSDRLEELNERIEAALKAASAAIIKETAYAKTEIKATYKRRGFEVEDGKLFVYIAIPNDIVEYNKSIKYSDIADNVDALAQQIIQIFSYCKEIFEGRVELMNRVECASINATKVIQEVVGYKFYSIKGELQIKGALNTSILVLTLVQGDSSGCRIDSYVLDRLNYFEIPERKEDLEGKILSLCEKFTKLSFTKKPSPSKT